MPMTAEQLWEATLGELEVDLSKPNFTTWFSGTFILEWTESEIIIGVPNNFTRTWLENKYHANIAKTLRKISGNNVMRVLYKVASPKAGQASSAPKPVTPEPAIEPIAPKKPQETEQKQPESPADSPDAVGLNPRYTFENFVVGKKNELAHAACLAVADQPGSVYNPLFMYGGVGLGKTHLMQAVGHSVKKRDSSKKILYVTCETFTNEYIKSVGEGQADRFKEKYRSVDVLMVDDIQFLAGKEGTQEAFFHTFNHLHQHNKQVILTSDRPPRAIPTLEHRLISRFEGGMIVDVSLPDLETRIAILTQKCRERGYPLPDAITQLIASNVQNNIRELEGVLNRVIAHHQLNNIEPTEETVRGLLSSYAKTPKRGSVSIKKILSTVSDYFDVSEDDLRGSSRKKELVVPRQIAMYLMREEVSASYPNIGQELGGRDHTTAMHACQKISKLLEEDERLESDLNMLRERLYN